MPILDKLPWSFFFRRSLPDATGIFEAPLEDAEGASIERDSWGVPHIVASVERDLWFLQGVAHGQDRLWQMHSARMLASGRLCEFAGDKVLDLDRLARQLGLRLVAEGDHEELRRAAAGSSDGAAALAMMQAYADGINFAKAETVKMMPVEFWLTGQRTIEPWTVVDSLAVMRLYGFVMCFGFQHMLLRHALVELFGKERALAWTSTTDSEASAHCTVDAEASEAFRKADLSGVFNRGTDTLPRGQGSNWWVVHGSRTKSGKPLLVGDPHLSIKIPNFWYEVHLRLTSGLDKPPLVNAYGVSPPGIPTILVGNTGFFATSITLAYTDVEDIFLERFRRSDGKYLHKGEWHECVAREELIIVKGRSEPERCICRSTVHGEILAGKSMMRFDPFKKNLVEKARGDDFADDEEVVLAYAGLPVRPKSLGVLGLRKMMFARSFAEFDEGLSYTSRTIALNFAYADIEGHIGYVMTGEVPIRGGGRGSELLPLVGWSGHNDWTGFVQHADLPKAYDPPNGFLISANSRIVDYSSYPHYLGETWKSGYRAKSIAHELEHLFEQHGLVSHEHMQELLSNVKSLAALEFVDVLREITPEADTKDAYDFLLDFDGVLSKDSVRATLYQVVHSELVLLLFKAGCSAVDVPPPTPIWEGLDQDQLTGFMSGDGFEGLGTLKHNSESQGHLHRNLLKILRSSPADSGLHWWLQRAGGRDSAVNAALRAAVAQMVQFGGSSWQSSEQAAWGAVHVCHIQHSISKSMGLSLGASPFDIQSVGCGGDTNTIAQSATKSLTDFTATSSNVSLRVIFDLSDLSSSASNLIVAPTGQSGQFNSMHFQDQQPLWSTGRMRPVVSTRLETHSVEEVMRFRTGSRGVTSTSPLGLDSICCSRQQRA